MGADNEPVERSFAALFQDLLTGDLQADDPEAERFFREYPGLDRLWAEHSETAKLLDAGGYVERETLLEIAHSVPAPGEAAVAAIVGRLRPRPEEPPRPPLPRPPRWFWVTLGVVALILALRALMRWTDTPERSPNELLYAGTSAEIPQLVQPLGRIPHAELERFAWRLDPTNFEGQHFIVVLFDPQDEELGRSIPIRKVEPRGEWEWRPLAGEIARIIDAGGCHWQVELWDDETLVGTSELGEVLLGG